MQTRGLSSDEKRSDGRLKSIFWPRVENAWDVDSLGRQGFWICLAVTVLSLLIPLISGNPILILTGAASAVAFMLGGMGIRERSWPAAALVFGIYALNLIYSLASGLPPGILSLIVAGILLSNLRATFLASRWRPASEDEDKPSRFNDSFTDILVDKLPAKLWPKLRFPFFALAALLLLLSAAGVVLALVKNFGAAAGGGIPH
jgi:hypothetical protein